MLGVCLAVAELLHFQGHLCPQGDALRAKVDKFDLDAFNDPQEAECAPLKSQLGRSRFGRFRIAEIGRVAHGRALRKLNQRIRVLAHILRQTIWPLRLTRIKPQLGNVQR